MTSPAQAKTTSKGRTYEWNGVAYKSVTTILKYGIPKGDVLTRWAAKMVAEAVGDMLYGEGNSGKPKFASFAALKRVFNDKRALVDHLKQSPWRYRDRKADIGSRVHAWVEAYTLGQTMPEPDLETKGYLAAFLAFVRDFQPEFVASEATAYSLVYGYAGTFDWIAYLNLDGKRVLCLGDWKTSKGVYPEYALQLCAYGHADFIGLPGGVEAPLPEIERTVVVHLEPNGNYGVFPLRYDETVFRVFEHAIGVAELEEIKDSFVTEYKHERGVAA